MQLERTRLSDRQLRTDVTVVVAQQYGRVGVTQARSMSRNRRRYRKFPGDWLFEGSVRQRYTQIGNAVPPRLGRIAGAAAATPRMRTVLLEPCVRRTLPSVAAMPAD